MARQHLVESFSGPRSLYKDVTDTPKYQTMVESFRKTKKSLKESTMNGVQKALRESKLDTELAGKVMKNLQEQGLNNDIKLWQFPISRINTKDSPNLNGRVYNKQLWENVIKKQEEIWKGGTGLANHPEDDEDGDFMKQSIVWLDGFIGDDGYVYGVGTFVGDGGTLAQQIIDVGGRIGFSSSGYGDFLTDGITVDPDDYEIDRLADLVLNPSQGVYGNHADNLNAVTNESKEKNNMKTKVTESTKKTLNESVFKITFEDGTTKETENFNEVKSALKDKLKNKDEAEDFEELDVGEFEDTYVGAEADKFEGVKSVEIPEDFYSTEEDTEEKTKQEECTGEDCDEDEELEEEITLSEKLLADHYKEAIKSIGKKDNGLWEEKINELKSLVTQLKKESLSKSSKVELNTLNESTINGITKDTAKAIQEGYEARKFCEELQISSLKKLSGIKEKIEDFASLEALLEKTTKEANKYKALYESKVKTAEADAKDNFEQEQVNESLKQKVTSLKESLRASKELNESLKGDNAKINARNKISAKNNDALRESLNEATNRATILSRKNKALKEALDKARTEKDRTSKLLEASNSKVSILKEKNMQLQDLLEEAEKTINVLEKSVKEAKAGRKVMESRALDERKAKRLAERKERMTIHGIDGNVVAGKNLFRESDEINSFLDEIDGTDNLKESIKDSKTLKEAQNKYLFSNELLSEEAEEARSRINTRRAKGTPSTLAEMFK